MAEPNNLSELKQKYDVWLVQSKKKREHDHDVFEFTEAENKVEFIAVKKNSHMNMHFGPTHFCVTFFATVLFFSRLVKGTTKEF